MIDNEIAVGDAWAVWMRRGLERDGEWYLIRHTVRGTRVGSIRAALGRYGLGVFDDEAEWRSLRRRGLVACRRVRIAALGV